MKTQGFLKVPRIYFDSAIAGAIGIHAFLVYWAIRRFERRDRSFQPKIAKLMDDGFLVGYANQTKIAVLVGISRSSVTRAIRLLTCIGWIKEVRLKDNGRACIVGFDSQPDEKGQVVSIYFAEAWLERTLVALPDDCDGWRHDALRRRRDALVGKLQRVADGHENVFGSRMHPKDTTTQDRASGSSNGIASPRRDRKRPRATRE